MTRDVHRALELLEEYHANLFRSSDVELKYSIEKVVNAFKTGLFNALCDIQEFYERVLLNERLSHDQKIYEAQTFARRWDATGANLIGTGSKPLGPFPVTTYSRPGSAFGGSHLGQTTTTTQIVDNYGREFEYLDITVDATRSGLGFSISGGTDREDEHIRVTNISQGGAVAADGRVRVGDIILQVNDADCTFVPHAKAVQALNEAGPMVRLLIKRERPQRSYSQSHLAERSPALPPDVRPVHKSRSLHQLPQPQVQQQPQSILARPSSRLSYGVVQPASVAVPISEAPRVVFLRKGDAGLGFNIVGGEMGGEPIYISHIVPGGVADLSGQVLRGDVLLRVNNIDLQGASHSTAASTLKSIPPHSFVELFLQYRPRESAEFFEKLKRASNPYLNQGFR